MPTSRSVQQPEAIIFSYTNSAPLGYTDGTILTDETGGKVLNPLLSLVSFLTLSYSQDWRVCSRSSVVSGSSEASGEYTFLKQCLYKYRLSYEQGPAKPSWKEDFQSFIANLKLPWDSISCCSTVYNCL